MKDIVSDLSEPQLIRTVIRGNWENYHYCLGRSATVELSVGKYLTWLVTNMPDHFMNLVVCTELPAEGVNELIGNALSHFRSLNITRLSWLTEDGVPATEIKKHLESHGLTFRESFATEMAAELTSLSENIPSPNGLKIVPVEDKSTLRQWIHVASVGFGVATDVEDIWYGFFAEAVCERPFRTYLALLDDEPVGTSQLFTSAGVAGIYNVTCMPQARGQGIGAAITLAPLLEARQMGYRVAILQASSMGYKVYQRLGFRDYGKLSVYLWEQERDQLGK